MMKHILYIIMCTLLPLSAMAEKAPTDKTPASSTPTFSATKNTAEKMDSSSVKPDLGKDIVAADADATSLKAKADKAYAAEKYDVAANLYLLLTKQGQNANVYYNLANSYYRLDDIAHAIVWYERALLLNPGDDDIRANLQFVRTKTVDKIVPEEDIFFVSWYHSLLNTMSVSGWVWTGIILFALALICLAFYFFGAQITIRKVGFFSAVILFVLTVCCNIFAAQQRSRQQHRDRAVVMTESVVVKSAPNDTSRDLFLLHTGTSMQILDDSMHDWFQIRLSDGKEGWIPAKSLEVI